MKPIENIVLDLGQKCDRRTKALTLAVDALEAIQIILLKSKLSAKTKERLISQICEKTLDQIELQIKQED